MNDTAKREHIYLGLHAPAERKNVLEKLLKHPFLHVEELEQDVLTLQWQNGIISNYDYLLHLNR